MRWKLGHPRVESSNLNLLAENLLPQPLKTDDKLPLYTKLVGSFRLITEVSVNSNNYVF